MIKIALVVVRLTLQCVLVLKCGNILTVGRYKARERQYVSTVEPSTRMLLLRDFVSTSTDVNAVHNLSNAWLQRRHKDLPRRGAQHL